METRVLIVSPVPSHPINQGNAARIQMLAAQLSLRGARLDFFYYGMEGITPQFRKEMEGFWNQFHFVPSLPLHEPTFGRYWGIDDWCPDELCRAVAELHSRNVYDVVIVNYVWMSKVLVGLKGATRIIDTHDLFADRHLISIQQGLEPRWFFTSEVEEDRGFGRADVLLGIQTKESEEIRSRVEIPVMTIGHLMPPRFLQKPLRESPRFQFGYLGSANPWNIRSIQLLDKELAEGYSGVDWLVAGTILKKPLHLKSSPCLLGFVENLEEFYSAVRCVINPMSGGTGLKIKTVEALSFGKPVIGTADAFVGLPARHDAHRLTSVSACADVMRAYAADNSLREEIDLASRVLYFEYALEIGLGIDRLWDVINRRSLSLAQVPFGSDNLQQAGLQ